jgi:hypothetical protein
MANEDRARFPRLRVPQPMDTRGTDQIAADDRVFAAQGSALADVLPSGAGSVTEKVLARRYNRDKKMRAWNQI